MRVTFPRWPTWNYQFPELDVQRIRSVSYVAPDSSKGELDRDKFRLAIGRNGVSVLVLLDKGNLPAIADRADAVAVDYDA